MVSIFDITTKAKICDVSGPSGHKIGSDLAVYDHSDSAHDSSESATVFVSGMQTATNLHYVTELHVLPPYNSGTITCVL